MLAAESAVVVQGLLVKMITGDQALIGRETAKQLGMGTNIFNTEVLLKVCFVAPGTMLMMADAVVLLRHA